MLEHGRMATPASEGTAQAEVGTPREQDRELGRSPGSPAGRRGRCVALAGRACPTPMVLNTGRRDLVSVFTDMTAAVGQGRKRRDQLRGQTTVACTS